MKIADLNRKIDITGVNIYDGSGSTRKYISHCEVTVAEMFDMLSIANQHLNDVKGAVKEMLDVLDREGITNPIKGV